MTFRWEQFQKLQATTLKTTGRGERFTVLSVDSERISIVVGPQARPQTIVRGQFERAHRLGLMTPDVTPSQLAIVNIAGGRTAYAAAIIRAVVQNPGA
ncbi:MAG: hypothetical protein QM692_20665 [Thermomicrobiales bacterium]